MRGLFAFALGMLAGAVAVVLWFTVDPDFDARTEAVAGGGNITVTFDERALAAIIARELPAIPGVGERPAVDVEVLQEGLVGVTFGVGAWGVGTRASVYLDPEVADGRLVLRVARATLGGLTAPEAVAALIEPPLQERLDEAAGELPYRLVAIRTTDRRLALDLALD
ncbi:hypothetical protein [Tepidiforma sp.]|jgi:hypothetical protein|uniref:hypothetical protein n=1 Tax=Tepidiforma sp. TaxID=2682230 RepID=UPI0021DC9368|nr:hypothetical protein [Tepidiforma sp.]MCX7617244.1 hypothetical protein [Tepidiforma sp.]GIW18689.1 MAG: hypothetical protein KatS3mg064_1846 [Tepidiforma sp.]